MVMMTALAAEEKLPVAPSKYLALPITEYYNAQSQ